MDPKLGFAIIPPEWNPYDHAFLGVPIKLGEYFLDSLADLPFEVEFIYSKGCSKQLTPVPSALSSVFIFIFY